MFNNYPDILNVPQVAKALGVGKTSVYKLIAQKKIGALYVGKIIKVPKFALEEYVKTSRSNVAL